MMIPLWINYLVVAAGFFLVAVPGFFAAGFVAAFAPRTMVILLIFTGLNGRSPAPGRWSRGMRAIFFTRVTVAGVHCPKMVYPPFRSGVGCSVMKNCEPFEFGNPVLAYASRPARSKFSQGAISSPNATPVWPEPVPEGSPPWIMKLGMTR